MFDHSNKTDAQTETNEPLFLHGFFERAVRRYPDRIALEIPPSTNRNRKQLTYEELDQRVDKLASHLSKFVGEESVVAILLSRSTENLYISQLAAMKAGAAYTCIDPIFPDDQAANILEDSAAAVLLTDRNGISRSQNFGFDAALRFDVEEVLTSNESPASALEAPGWLKPESLAYIIYTSGTTGRPKGVMIEHRSIVNLVSAEFEEFRISTDDRVAQNSSSAYDSSVEETWLAFAAGATLVPLDDETVRLGPDLVPWLRKERITVLCPAPTMLRTTGCPDPDRQLPDLRFVYVGGEALPRDVADRWAKGRLLVNGYGPTECAVTALRGRIFPGAPITIGRPFSGIKAWVLNETLEEVADGEQGELCIGGVCLARGYRNRPELTSEKFPEHPKFGRIYHTGDLVHRKADGSFFYHGRIDSQVKLRGYRIELEAIEARLSECEGVREAACTVQGTGTHQNIVAFIVPSNSKDPSFDELKTSLAKILPSYMIPGRIATIEALPRTVGGKLNRSKLPILNDPVPKQNGHLVLPRDEMEEKLSFAFREVLSLHSDVSVHDDFFNDLSGDSLSAAELISLLRGEPLTASLTVRDLYEARTIAGLATRVNVETFEPAAIRSESQKRSGHPIIASLWQLIWILAGLTVVSAIGYPLAFDVLPVLKLRLGLIPFLVFIPLIVFTGLAIYTPLALLVVTGIKRVLIGRYRSVREPVWGSFYVRNWMVQQSVRIVPWALLEGTVFQIMALRMLGAKIGRNVHIHRGVGLLHGGWDLLEIGDNVTISQDAAIRLVDFDDGHIVVDAIRIEDDCTLDIRCGVSGDTVLERGAYLTALSNLASGARIPEGELWDGIPAKPAGTAPSRPEINAGLRPLTPFVHGVVFLLARASLVLVVLLPLVALTIALALLYNIDAMDAVLWMDSPTLDSSFVFPALLLATLPGPLALGLEAIVIRLLGRVHEGTISRWSLDYIRVWLKTRIVQSASDWLSGTLFWPVWLRMAGMKIGHDCEISTIIDVVPELIEIGQESFFADGIYLGGPLIHRGTVTLLKTRLSRNTFLGNHSVVRAGQSLPSDILLGVCTAVDQNMVRSGTSWFGHPAFELPRREIVEVDRSLTHNPSLIRYLNRIFWETLRSALPVLPLLVTPLWLNMVSRVEHSTSRSIFLLAFMPLALLGFAAFFCLLVLALKWVLLGKVRPDTHPLWSCWCSRWDFLYVAWAVYATRLLMALEGTLWLSWYLRAMGMRIGKRVVLGSGFTQVVDPDMLEFEDGATVSCQFQAHTFEDRVLKIDRIRIRSGATVGGSAVLLYGAEIGARSYVAPHSVVMKRENLLADHSYAGCPTRPIRDIDSIKSEELALAGSAPAYL